MELYEGRPQNCEGRLEKEIRTYDLLDSLGLWYQRTDHEPADTMEACNRIDQVLVIQGHHPQDAGGIRLAAVKIHCRNPQRAGRSDPHHSLDLIQPGNLNFLSRHNKASLLQAGRPHRPPNRPRYTGLRRFYHESALRKMEYCLIFRKRFVRMILFFLF
jgi:hypothetical protein